MRKIKRKGQVTAAAFLAIALALLLASSASAATVTWDGEVNGDWSTPNNWVGDAAPVNGDEVIISTEDSPDNDPTNYDLGGGVNLASVTFEDGPSTEPLNVGGSPIRLASGGSMTNNRTAANSTELVSGAILTGAVSVTQNGSGGSSFDVSGTVSGSGQLTKSGAGTLTLGSANTYAGGTAINAGVVSIAAANRLGIGSLSLDGGTLQTTAGMSYTGVVDLGAGGGTIEATTGTFTLTNTVSGSGQLTKSGAGTLTLGSANTYAGGTAINAGVVSIAAANRLGIGSLSLDGGTLQTTAGMSYTGVVDLGAGGGTIEATTGTFTLTNTVSGSGQLTKSGAGTLTLGSANTYAGGTAINAGVVSIAAANRLGIGSLSLNGGTLQTTAGMSYTRNVNLVNGGGTFETTAGTLTLNGAIAGAGLLTKAGGGTLALSSANTYTGGTAINAGVVSIAAANRLGSGGLTLAGGTLRSTASTAIAQSVTLGVGGGVFDVTTGQLTLERPRLRNRAPRRHRTWNARPHQQWQRLPRRNHDQRRVHGPDVRGQPARVWKPHSWRDAADDLGIHLPAGHPAGGGRWHGQHRGRSTHPQRDDLRHGRSRQDRQ